MLNISKTDWANVMKPTNINYIKNVVWIAYRVGWVKVKVTITKMAYVQYFQIIALVTENVQIRHKFPWDSCSI